MTFTIKSETIGKTFIEISQEKFSSAYTVCAGTVYGDTIQGIETRTYSTLKQAKARYNALRRSARSA
jgi:hypothetical protein